jgi:N,N'-diacetyllegionaminate synthase
MRTLIIAEAGVNHNGDLSLARELVVRAAAAGADIVKFQTFVTASSISRHAPKAQYQRDATGDAESQYEMVKRLELSPDDHLALKEECRRHGIGFLSTAFDIASFELLRSLDVDRVKVPSGELTNLPFLRYLAQQGLPMLVSTGMATLGEVDAALQVIEAAGTPRGRVTLLHCNTEYPTPMQDVNLHAMVRMRAAFSVEVGYSDHTRGIEVPVAAVALGATVIEKHLTLDRALPGPDHQASLEPDELAAMCASIRNVEAALGDGIKRPSPSEARNRLIARKSIVASRPIRAGERFTADNLATKRPGTGLSPMRWDEVLDTVAQRDYDLDDPIQP